MSAKWRPPLWMVIAAILAIVLALPLSGLVFLRLYENQFVRQTEAELIAQGHAVAAAYKSEIISAAGLDLSTLRSVEVPRQIPSMKRVSESSSDTGRYRPVEPNLDLATSEILPQRPDALPPQRAADPAYAPIGAKLSVMLDDIQKATLAGFRVLDGRGTVIAGGSEMGLSLAHVPEVAAALKGQYASVIRVRETDQPPPPLYSISRGTRIRIFAAIPVVIDERVAGVVYVSRTPSHILRHLYGERGKVALWVAFVLGGSLLAGLLLMRTIASPLRALLERSRRLAAGDRSALVELPSNGTREMAALAEGFLVMARKLQDRSDYIRSFASHVSHELKSPLTSIRGAAELIRDDDGRMTDEERKRFADHIAVDTIRLDRLLARLREHARAETMNAGGEHALLRDAIAALAKPDGLGIRTEMPTDFRAAMSTESIGIVLSNLAANAASHGAKMLTVTAGERDGASVITVADDGEGISPGNRDRVFEPFFTTRRDDGGTGMGLHIVKTLIEAHGGTIRLLDVPNGAAFEIAVPTGS